VAPLFRVARDTRQPRHQGPNRHLGRVGISLYESLSISRITITSRNTSVSSSSAVRTSGCQPCEPRRLPPASSLYARCTFSSSSVGDSGLRLRLSCVNPVLRTIARIHARDRRLEIRRQTGVRAGTLPALPPVRRGHHAPAIGVPGIQQRQERAGEIDGFGFVRQSPFFARMSPVSSRLRARQFYSRLTLSLDRGNFFTRFESCL
jgi:hypothetical protein